MQAFIKKGLCFKCDNKWEKGHKCSPGQAFVLEIGSDDDLEGGAISDGRPSKEDPSNEETSQAFML